MQWLQLWDNCHWWWKPWWNTPSCWGVAENLWRRQDSKWRERFVFVLQVLVWILLHLHLFLAATQTQSKETRIRYSILLLLLLLLVNIFHVMLHHYMAGNMTAYSTNNTSSPFPYRHSLYPWHPACHWQFYYHHGCRSLSSCMIICTLYCVFVVKLNVLNTLQLCKITVYMHKLNIHFLNYYVTPIMLSHSN